jgi:hypothetical protein
MVKELDANSKLSPENYNVWERSIRSIISGQSHNYFLVKSQSELLAEHLIKHPISKPPLPTEVMHRSISQDGIPEGLSRTYSLIYENLSTSVLTFVASAVLIIVTTVTKPTILGSATGFALATLLARFTACFLAMVEEAPDLSPWVVEYLPATYRIRSASTMNDDIAMVSPQAAAAILLP